MSDKHEQVIKAALAVMDDMRVRKGQLLSEIQAAKAELAKLNDSLAVMTYELKSLGVDVGMKGAELSEWLGELHPLSQGADMRVSLRYTHAAHKNNSKKCVI